MNDLFIRLNEVLTPQLSEFGFERVRPRRWVKGNNAPIREIFEFQGLKGAAYSARWGFSLDFVPLLRNGTFRWKRTSRSAEFDLAIDPIDESGEVPCWCSFARSPTIQGATSKEVILRVGSAAASAALRDFERVSSIGDLLSIFSERAAMSFQRFSLEHYVQTHLAWGLGLIALGESAAGRVHLEQFCNRFGIDPENRIIRAAASEAANSSRLG